MKIVEVCKIKLRYLRELAADKEILIKKEEQCLFFNVTILYEGFLVA